MVMRIASRCVAALFALLAWLRSSPAVAEIRGIVLVSGSAAEQYGAGVGRVIEAVVRGAGWSLPPEQLTKIESDGMLECLGSKQAASCVPASLQIARVFIVKIESGEAIDGAPMVVLTGKGIVIESAFTVSRQRYCVFCGDDRVMAASAELAKSVLQGLAPRAETSVVELRPVPRGPEGALLMPDALIGAGGALAVTGAVWLHYGTQADPEGKPRYAHATALGLGAMVIGLGTASLGAYLLWEDAWGRAEASAGRGWPRPAALLMAGGVAAMITGGVLFALDEDVYPVGPQEPIYLDSAGPGIALGLAGAVALGAGIWWWSQPKLRSPVPIASVGRSGAMIGWARRF
jgi:hypothetical protein